jgi:putative sigma-54 modulation protein
MDIRIKGRNIHVTEALKGYAHEKMSRLPHFLGDLIRAEVELSVEKNPRIENSQVAEVTIFTQGPVVRGKESAPDMYAAIDLVIDKIERQVKRYKSRNHDIHKNHRETPRKMPAFSEVPTDAELEAADSSANIVKMKRIEAKPMSADEATAQMELLGHDFFVFRNADTEQVNVVYRRRQGAYGLIEPEA